MFPVYTNERTDVRYQQRMEYAISVTRPRAGKLSFLSEVEAMMEPDNPCSNDGKREAHLLVESGPHNTRLNTGSQLPYRRLVVDQVQT